MTITPQEKILSVLQLITELSQLGISGEPVVIEEKDLKDKKIADEDFSRIIKKLVSEGLISAKAHQTIQLDGRLTLPHEIEVLDEQAFNEYASKLHAEVHSDIVYLQGDKFLALADVLHDLYGQLQMTQGSNVAIPIVPQIIRFPNLMPADSAGMRDRYGDLRMEAVKYLRDRKVIVKSEVIRGEHRWVSKVGIGVNRIVFQSFFDRFAETYAKRVKEEKPKPPLQEEKKRKAQLAVLNRIVEEADTEKAQNAKITKAVNEELEKRGVQNSGIIMPTGTKWEDITIQFIDGENVKIFLKGKLFKETNLNEMGLHDRRAVPRRENRQGKLLKVFAKLNGELGWDDPEASNKYVKHKQLLCDALHEFFRGVEGDPIEWVKKDKVYRSKVALVPEGEEVKSSEVVNEKYSDLESEYKQMTEGGAGTLE